MPRNSKNSIKGNSNQFALLSTEDDDTHDNVAYAAIPSRTTTTKIVMKAKAPKAAIHTNEIHWYESKPS